MYSVTHKHADSLSCICIVMPYVKRLNDGNISIISLGIHAYLMFSNND